MNGKTPIDWELHLYVRTYHALRRKEIRYVEQLQAMSDAEILNIRNIGDKGLKDIREQIERWEQRQANEETRVDYSL